MYFEVCYHSTCCPSALLSGCAALWCTRQIILWRPLFARSHMLAVIRGRRDKHQCPPSTTRRLERCSMGLPIYISVCSREATPSVEVLWRNASGRGLSRRSGSDLCAPPEPLLEPGQSVSHEITPGQYDATPVLGDGDYVALLILFTCTCIDWGESVLWGSCFTLPLKTELRYGISLCFFGLFGRLLADVSDFPTWRVLSVWRYYTSPYIHFIAVSAHPRGGLLCPTWCPLRNSGGRCLLSDFFLISDTVSMDFSLFYFTDTLLYSAPSV